MINKAKPFYFYTLFILCFLSCESLDVSPHQKQEIEKNIKALQTHDDKETYLNFLFQEDQRLRQGQYSQILVQNGGRKTKELKEFVRKQMRLDLLNQARAEKYLEIHGFPAPGQFNEIASSAIPTIVLHSSYKVSKRFYPYMLEAYQTGQMDASSFAGNLHRMYETKHGQRYQMKSGTYKPEDEIVALIVALKLD